jgi:hypothetical protein
MGIGLFVMYEKAIVGADAFATATDGKFFSSRIGVLDEICQELDLKPFTRFMPDIEALVKLARKSPKKAGLIETWFVPDEGLQTIARLTEALQSTPQGTNGLSEAEVTGLVECLQLLGQDLQVAKRNDARFCLTVDT